MLFNIRDIQRKMSPLHAKFVTSLTDLPCIKFEHFEPFSLVKVVETILIEKAVKTVGKILEKNVVKKMINQSILFEVEEKLKIEQSIRFMNSQSIFQSQHCTRKTIERNLRWLIDLVIFNQIRFKQILPKSVFTRKRTVNKLFWFRHVLQSNFFLPRIRFRVNLLKKKFFVNQIDVLVP